MSGESVARDQIKCLARSAQKLYVERRNAVFRQLTGEDAPVSAYPDHAIMPAQPRRAPKGNGVPLADAEYWLEHCALLAGRMDDFDHETRRGYTIACRLLGLGWDEAQRAIGATRTSGTTRAAMAWASHLSAPDARYIGLVYVARHARSKGISKVGFTTNLSKRLKALSRIEGEPVIAVSAIPGTMLIEWALHMDLGRCVKPEWYPQENIPVWLVRRWVGEVA